MNLKLAMGGVSTLQTTAITKTHSLPTTGRLVNIYQHPTGQYTQMEIEHLDKCLSSFLPDIKLIRPNTGYSPPLYVLGVTQNIFFLFHYICDNELISLV